jgi:hypothetical protein
MRITYTSKALLEYFFVIYQKEVNNEAFLEKYTNILNYQFKLEYLEEMRYVAQHVIHI